MNRLASLAYVLPARVGSTLSWLPPLLARLAVGSIFIGTGWGKLSDLGPVIEFFRELGIPYPELQAPFVASVELVGGALVAIGFLSRLASLPLAATMVVAIATAQWSNVDSASALLGLDEFVYLVIFAWIATAGPGAVSVDAAVETYLLGDAEEVAPMRGVRRYA